MKKTKFETMTSREKILWLLESNDEYGGPQSVNDICKNLNIPNTNVRSLVIRMMKTGKIERISKGVYRIVNDKREYFSSKPEMKLD
jgi:predicted transcriptional regulator of viral defense system